MKLKEMVLATALGASALVGCTKEPEAMLEPIAVAKDAGVSEPQSYKLAQYLANGNLPSQGIVGTSEEYGRSGNGIKWEVDHAGIKYTVIASPYENKSKPARLRIWLNPLPRGQGTGESFLMDNGLDDVVDQGTIDDKTTLFNQSGKVLAYDPTVPPKIMPGWEIGSQHRPFVQDVYGKVLETLQELAGYRKAK